MRLLSWNVNSILTICQYYPWNENKNYNEIFKSLSADILCLQEMKVSLEKVEKSLALVEDFDSYFSFSKIRKGYSGVATFVRKTFEYKPIEAFDGFCSAFKAILKDDLEWLNNSGDGVKFTYEELRTMDEEGRIIVTDHSEFVVINVYCPNQTDNDRLQFKMRFHYALELFATLLLKNGKKVIVAGDLNVCRQEIDHCDPKKSIKDSGLKSFGDHPARKWLNSFVASESQFVDLYRYLNPETTGAFTCWDTLLNARPSNYGVRIDYVIISRNLIDSVVTAGIESSIVGSDHCPVSLELKIPEKPLAKSYRPPKLCSCYWDKFSSKQQKITAFLVPAKKRDVTSCTETVEEVKLEKKQRVTEGVIKERKFTTMALSSEWSHLPFGNIRVPDCLHGEPCKEMTVNKKGVNKGRKFYMCSRGIGPKAEKNRLTEYRCDFFQWKSEASKKPN